MRIIAGRWKGRCFAAPDGHATRPLPDRIRQAIFDAHAQQCCDETGLGLCVADVCAGSGSFGLEAFSRGAREVHFIESGRHAVPVLRRTIAQFGNPRELRLHAAPFQSVLPKLRHLDLIFADPPFPWFRDDRAQLAELLHSAATALAPHSRLIVRSETSEELPPEPLLHLTDLRTYGRSTVAVFTQRT